MSRGKKPTLKTVLIISILVFVMAFALYITTYRKTEYKQNEAVDFSDFTISVLLSEKNNLKFSDSNLIDFYKAVWGRTENDITDCSKVSDIKTSSLQFNSTRDDCTRVNDDIRRDLSSKKEIAAYENSNYRLNLTYAITSKSNYLGVGDVDVRLVSGEENLSEKKFKYHDFYHNEAQVSYDKLIDKGYLTKGLTRTGLIWADVSNTTKVLQLKITYKAKVKTVSITDFSQR